MSFDGLHKATEDTLLEEVDQICQQFIITPEKLDELTAYFIEQMELGLNSKETNTAEHKGLPMIPTFVTGKPNGTESGVLLAADLGGSHFRVCSVTLNGDHTYHMEQLKSKIPEELLEENGVTSEDLFGYLARRTKAFLTRNHPELLKPNPGSGKIDELKMGFTFSYPIAQSSLNSGKLIRWTKGFNIPDTVGKDVVELFQEQLSSYGLDMIDVVALTNDTTGTFLSHCYTSGANTTSGEISEPVIGCIFGSGTNGCYMEDIDNIKKIPQELRETLIKEGKEKMCINTEWGSFDNDLKHLPTTKWDEQIDQEFSTNPGFHLFEKRVSGMYLGEILRCILVDLHSKKLLLQQYRNHDQLPHRLKTPFQLQSEVLARIEIDDSSTLRETELSFLQSLRLPTTLAERKAIQNLVRVITRRSAYLASVPIAAILIKTNALGQRYHGEVEIGCDGSVIEYYPGFRSMLRHALSISPIGYDGERKIHLRIAKDGSGVGAALCALVA
ncbi:glucokinase-1 [Monosporozyma servazzii]